MDTYVCKQDRQHAAATPPPYDLQHPLTLRLLALFGNQNAWYELVKRTAAGDEEAQKYLEEYREALGLHQVESSIPH